MNYPKKALFQSKYHNFPDGLSSGEGVIKGIKGAFGVSIFPIHSLRGAIQSLEFPKHLIEKVHLTKCMQKKNDLTRKNGDSTKITWD